MRRLRKPRFLLTYPLVVALFVFGHSTEGRLLWGSVVVLLGEALRLWANGYVGHKKVNRSETLEGRAKAGLLITAGPYAYVRHPLYLGTGLLATGFTIAIGSWILGIVALAGYYLIYRWRMRKEEEILEAEWGETFLRYRRNVPQWLPTGRRNPEPQGDWSWQGIRASQELKTLAWVLVLLIVIYFKHEWWQERERFEPQSRFKQILLLVLLVALILADGIYELRKRWRRRAQARADVRTTE